MVRVVTTLLEILPINRNTYRQDTAVRLSVCTSPVAENRSVKLPRESLPALNSDRDPLHNELCLVSIHSN
jgi:hypothetical protein